ncbi:flagellar biosynthetic protein FlhB [Alkaliphilus metalliredigens QYMF]|uniref:Flagellar biosynthetic protein FlhB n=1 Tax=Alkaliphilus metalliredigens (strain QYMF) TaxID=293826 RepID=A6TRN8_ALKMQ|nr:flagellar biosynthesis protein FlhB [Alkaliphilus metalliredigens]ABR48856.1 flagellar biosynthetic protein FlhB [Alkaliphilus metalliredigens QYMF]
MQFKINLQLFTEEKTERPTPKKRKDSREKGQVLQSKELNSAFLLIGAFVILGLFSSYIGMTMKSFTRSIYVEYLNTDYLFSIQNLYRLLVYSLYNLLKIIAPISIASLLIGLAVSYLQVGYLFTTKTLAFKLSKLNPIEGFKKIFSLKAIVELAKSFIKIGLVGYIVFQYAQGQLETIFNTMAMDMDGIIQVLIYILVNIGIRAGVVLLVLAGFDYLYQKYEYDKNLKMTKQETKEEYKQSEGNPQIKSKIKEKQRQMSTKRMMQEVPKADVIITNPTHFAIAIQYNPDDFQAPRVIAKGQDILAQSIKKVGLENDVPIVENKPLARSLYDTVEIGAFIPTELYQAVAEILAYVYRINNKV